MNYYLSLDGGGSKLEMRLFDDNFNLIAESCTGGIKTEQNTQGAIMQSLEQCFSAIPKNITELSSVRYVFVGDKELLKTLLHRRFVVSEMIEYKESEAGLLAGAGLRHGYVALAGTGSVVVHLNKNGTTDFLGGWGPMLGDEGSGVWIGLQALRATLRTFDGLQKDSLLTNSIYKAIGLSENPRRAIQTLQSDGSAYSRIASLTTIVAEAAFAGDAEALRILHEAGRQVAMQMCSLLRLNTESNEKEILLSGGVWKSHPVVVDGFYESLKVSNPDFAVRLPWFKTVTAGAMDLALNRGLSQNEAYTLLKEKFPKDSLA